MRTLQTMWVVVGAAALAGCATGGGRLAQAPAGLDLSGTWRYSAEASDAAVAMDTAVGPRPGMAPGSGGGMPGGGGMGGRGGMGSGRSGQPAARRPQVPPELLRPLREFVIEQAESVVTFRFATKNAVRVPTSGKQVTAAQWPEIGELQLSAHWTREGLRVQRSRPQGGSITEVISRAPGSARLIITTELDTPRGKRNFRRVYERVEPES